MNGQKHLQVKLEDSVHSLVYAWERMKPYKRLLRWAWTSRGLITEAEMLDLHPGMTAADLHQGDAEASICFKELVPCVPVLTPFLAQL